MKNTGVCKTYRRLREYHRVTYSATKKMLSPSSSSSNTMLPVCRQPAFRKKRDQACGCVGVRACVKERKRGERERGPKGNGGGVATRGKAREGKGRMGRNGKEGGGKWGVGGRRRLVYIAVRGEGGSKQEASGENGVEQVTRMEQGRSRVCSRAGSED